MTTDLYPTPAVTDLIGIMQYAQTVTNGIFSPVVLVLIFIVSFLSLKRFETKTALPASLFITSLCALFFYLMGLAQDAILYASILGLGLALLVNYLTRE